LTVIFKEVKMDKRRSLVVLVVVSVLIVACSLMASPGSKATPQDKGDSTQPASPSAQPSLESPMSDGDVFPLTPDPINVTATLDTEHAATYKKGSYNQSVETESADGILYQLELFKDTIFKEDENGELTIDYDSDITMTPVSAIEGLPFSQGYLAAVHLGPDGAILLRSADLTMEIPGEYDPSTLIGFAADGTGDDFHLYPATFSSSAGKTYAMFDVMHFSLYGVAQVLPSEIVAQKKHPPVKVSSQGEQELAPLLLNQPVEDDVTPLPVKQVLGKIYDQTLKKKTSDLSKIPCNEISKVVSNHNDWTFRVVRAGVTESFADTIDLDRVAMYQRLKECIKVTCDTCVNPKAGAKPDKVKTQQMLNLIRFAQELTIKLKLGDEAGNNWTVIFNKCAKAAGLPQQAAGIAADGGGSVPKATCP
jgi:hypothetical protein